METAKGRESTPEQRKQLVSSLDRLIDYRRKELELGQARIDRAETQAAGLVAGALAAGVLAITLLRSLGAGLSLLVIGLCIAGGVALMAGFLVAFTSRDPRIRMSRWFKLARRVKLVPKRLFNHTEELLDKRRAFGEEGLTVSRSLSATDPLILRETIADSLDKRVQLAADIAQWRDDVVRLSALSVVGGTALLLAASITKGLGPLRAINAADESFGILLRMARESWAKRFEQRTRGNPLLVLLFFVSTSLSAVVVLASAAIWSVNWYEDRFDWRDREYSKLTSLHAGFTRKKFEAVLGEPAFDRQRRLRRRKAVRDRRLFTGPPPAGPYREQIFRLREHWVQAVSDRHGTVILYSVTACGKDFKPTFRVPGTDDRRSLVQLNDSTFRSVVSDERFDPLVDFFGSGATANSHFYDIFYGGNPSNYKTFIWGLNDVCPDWFEYYGSRWFISLLPRHDPPHYRGWLSRAPSWVKRLRQESIVNTYAETAPVVELDDLTGTFQVGADRILTRTTQDESP